MVLTAVLLAALPPAPAAARAQSAPIEYVALGDSYSSGAGAGAYTDLLCQRSENAHPRLLAEELGADLTFAACGGATTGHVLNGQAGALDADTDLVTIGIGGNDIGWFNAIAACIVPLADCAPQIEEAERKATEELPEKLDDVYEEIADRAPAAEVYVTGYPRLFAARNTCDALGQISVAEQRRMNDAADLLSSVIEAAAEDHRFTYVDTRGAFDDHGICAGTPWLHGLTIRDLPYHPNAPGHRDGYFPTLLDAL
ncbi:SGNH/GDSL hydrolase family protein [Glycomyces sp. A-F 0318]|uniref:SGNH/GDSL hydrolase family protein n=1 Tax=Glycomyces amatae TaxID=2881355 RepID=UPI001E543FC6|nr:SGNH/GDSL hydrolase family protein [Glycomyces amatae]